MKRLLKASLIVLLSIALSISLSTMKTNAEKKDSEKELIILENVPEVEAEVENGEIQLQALNVYGDDHFKTTSDNLTWRSKNNNVATVDQNGKVTFTGQNGRSWITVSNGISEDKIAAHFKHGEPQIIKNKDEKYNIIDHAINKMTINEKIGQMLMPDFRKWNGENVTEMLPEIEQIVKDYSLGGVILFAENVVATEQTTKLVAAYKEASEKYELLLTIDQEGGIVTRLQSGTDMPGNMALGATRSPEITEEVGKVIGAELQALGINMNLAPVLDVNNNSDNPVIGVRSFGESPKLVSDLGIAYIKGIQSNGVATTVKHFPGHGDTAVDSHIGLPEVPHDKERLLEVELYPFQQAMEADVDAIMTGHVTFPKIDDTKVISKKDGTEISLPATLSHKVLTGLMREEMGYEGVIITDALNMRAITDHFGAVDAVIRSVHAGTDIILMPVGLEEVVDGLLEAVETGEITEERIEQSVKRILTLKLNRGVIKPENPTPVDELVRNAEEVVGQESHKKIETAAANQSITLIKNEQVLPLQVEENKKIVVVGNTYISKLHEAIRDYHANTELITASGPLTDAQLEQLSDASAVIFGSYTLDVNGRNPLSPQMLLVNQLIQEVDAPIIGAAIRNPYDIMAFPEIDAYLAQYGFRDASFEATAATIFGENNPTGTLPVTIPDQNGDVLYEFGFGLSY